LKAPKSAKPAKNLQKSASPLKKPEKTVEIRGFSIDFAALKAALFYDGRVLRSRMNTGVSRTKPESRSIHAVSISVAEAPQQQAARRGSPIKENKRWQQE